MRLVHGMTWSTGPKPAHDPRPGIWVQSHYAVLDLVHAPNWYVGLNLACSPSISMLTGPLQCWHTGFSSTVPCSPNTDEPDQALPGGSRVNMLDQALMQGPWHLAPDIPNLWYLPVLHGKIFFLLAALQK